MFEEIFRRKKWDPQKMAAYGFLPKCGKRIYETDILSGTFSLRVSVEEDGSVDTALTEIENGEPYVLYKTGGTGVFVGEVRFSIEAVLAEMADACCDPAVFKTAQAQMAIDYVRDEYGDEPEFLWEKFPDNAVWRRKDNRKWYGAILTVSGRKIGLNTDKTVEILDLRMKPEDRDAILASEHYYPGWHMNKKSWYTLVLDGSAEEAEIKRRIADSYALAKKA